MNHKSAGILIGIHANIPNSRLHLLENSGHGAEGADESIFRETVLHFLSRQVEK